MHPIAHFVISVRIKLDHFSGLLLSQVLSFNLIVFALQRILANDMPRLNFFDLLRESDEDFIARSGWQYNPSFTYAMIPDVQVLEPYRRLPRGGHGGSGGPGAGAGGQGVSAT